MKLIQRRVCPVLVALLSVPGNASETVPAASATAAVTRIPDCQLRAIEWTGPTAVFWLGDISVQGAGTQTGGGFSLPDQSILEIPPEQGETISVDGSSQCKCFSGGQGTSLLFSASVTPTTITTASTLGLSTVSYIHSSMTQYECPTCCVCPEIGDSCAVWSNTRVGGVIGVTATVSIGSQLRALITGDGANFGLSSRRGTRQISYMYLLTQDGQSILLRPQQNRQVEPGRYRVEIHYDASSDSEGDEYCGLLINVSNAGWPASYALSFIDPELADLNCDGELGVGDIGPFILSLIGGYAEAYPSCDISRADVDCDGYVTVGDIGGFVSLIASL